MKNIFFRSKISNFEKYFSESCPPPDIFGKVEKKRHPEKKSKINLTFGVFGVIPSYLARMPHNLFAKYGKNNFSEKLFSTQIPKIREGSNPTIPTTSLNPPFLKKILKNRLDWKIFKDCFQNMGQNPKFEKKNKLFPRFFEKK